MLLDRWCPEAKRPPKAQQEVQQDPLSSVVRHPEEAGLQAPAASGPFDDLQCGESQAVDGSEGHRQADRAQLVGAAAQAKGVQVPISSSGVQSWRIGPLYRSAEKGQRRDLSVRRGR